MTQKETIKALQTRHLSFDAYASQAPLSLLTDLTLDVGRTCSLKCVGACYRVDRRRPTRAEEYVSMDRLIHEVRASEKLLNITISGTEPFLHLDDDAESTRLATGRTHDILEELGVYPRPYRLGLITNGLDIHRHWDGLEALARRERFDYIDLSIDSGDPSAHDRMRGGKGVGEAVLIALREANRRLEGVRVSTSSVLRPDNAEGILRLIREHAFYNRHFFIAPLQPLPIGKGIQPMKGEKVVHFIRDVRGLLGEAALCGQQVEVTVLATGLHIYDLIEAGILDWNEVEEEGGLLSTKQVFNGNTLRIQLSILPSYGLNLGLLEFTGNYLPHAHALHLPHEQRGEWVAGNINDTPLHELHARGTRGIIQSLIRARTDHDCRNQPCWNTCFGGMAVNMEDAILGGLPLTARPMTCVRPGSRRLPVLP